MKKFGQLLTNDMVDGDVNSELGVEPCPIVDVDDSVGEAELIMTGTIIIIYNSQTSIIFFFKVKV